MKNLENTCGFYQRTYQRPHDDNDPNKALYWDGYQWVVRPQINSFAQEPLRPDRKIQIANVPLHLNLDVNLFKDFIIKTMIDKNVISASEIKNLQGTIKTLEFDKNKNTAILTMESVELAKHMILIDGTILLGHTLRVSAYIGNNGELSLDNINREAAFANSAQLSAKSAAISYAAFQNIIKKKDNVNFNFSTENKVVIPNSRIIKIMNAVDSNCKDNSVLDEVHSDMVEELEKFGKINSSFIVKKGKEKLGAEVGSVFVEFEDIHDAEVSILKMKGRLYEGREIKFVFFDENAFYADICPKTK
ncbi:MAG: hypothetical protein MJ252_05805 [archaeon]|nr:hypothetical protein [archaeon]